MSARSNFTASDCAEFSSASRHSPYSLRYVFPILTRLGYSLREKLIPKLRSFATKFNCASALGLGDGHHLHPDGAWLRLFGCRARLVQRRVLSWRLSITMEAAFCVATRTFSEHVKLINKCHFLQKLLGLAAGADFYRRDRLGLVSRRIKVRSSLPLVPPPLTPAPRPTPFFF